MPEELRIDQIKTKMDSLSKILDEAKTSKATMAGRLQESMRRLTEDLKIPSLEAATAEITRLEGEQKSLQDQTKEKFQALQGGYEW